MYKNGYLYMMGENSFALGSNLALNSDLLNSLIFGFLKAIDPICKSSSLSLRKNVLSTPCIESKKYVFENVSDFTAKGKDIIKNIGDSFDKKMSEIEEEVAKNIDKEMLTVEKTKTVKENLDKLHDRCIKVIVDMDCSELSSINLSVEELNINDQATGKSYAIQALQELVESIFKMYREKINNLIDAKVKMSSAEQAVSGFKQPEVTSQTQPLPQNLIMPTPMSLDFTDNEKISKHFITNGFSAYCDEVFKDAWRSMLESYSDIIDKYDLAVNATEPTVFAIQQFIDLQHFQLTSISFVNGVMVYNALGDVNYKTIFTDANGTPVICYAGFEPAVAS